MESLEWVNWGGATMVGLLGWVYWGGVTRAQFNNVPNLKNVKSERF